MMMTGCTFNGVHPETGRPYVHWMLEGLATGGGGRANADGWNASNLTSSNCLLPNVEIEEQRYPVRFIRRELVPDSGGAGRHRGGLACEGEVEVEVDCRVSVFGSRGPQCPPPGFLGGEPGAPAGSYVRGADGTVRPLPTKVADVSLKAGDRLVVRACGGGGYGPAADRAPELVEEDLAGGYVTEPGLGPYSPGRPA
jgi:N-methylhydantoinase B